MKSTNSGSCDAVSTANGISTANTKLFIGGLSYDTTDASLTRHFESYGQVASAIVLRDPTTLRSRGFGFVTFVDAQSAHNVLDVQMHTIDGRKVEAKFAVPRSASTASNSSSERTNSLNGYNGNEMSSNSNNRKALRKHSKQNVSVPLNGKNDRTKGKTNNKRQTRVNNATTHVPGNVWNSKAKMIPEEEPTVVVNNGRTEVEEKERGCAGNSGGREKQGLVPNKIFVGGLLYATGHESLRQYFERYGAVKTAEVIYNRDTKKSRGFGFVIFKDFEAVEQVLSEQNQSMHVVDGKHVEVKLCVARQDEVKESKSSKNNNSRNLYRHASTSSVSIESSKSSSSSINVSMETVTPWQSFAQVAAIGLSPTNEHQKPASLKNTGFDLLETELEPEPQSPLSKLNRNTPVFTPDYDNVGTGAGDNNFMNSPGSVAIHSPVSTASAPFSMYSQAFSPIGSNHAVAWGSPEQKQYHSDYGMSHISPLSLSASASDIGNQSHSNRDGSGFVDNQVYSSRSQSFSPDKLSIGENDEPDSIEQLGSHFSSLLSPRFAATNNTVVGDGSEVAFKEYSMFT